MVFTTDDARSAVIVAGIDLDEEGVTLEQLAKGMNVELEHGTKFPDLDITGDDPVISAKIRDGERTALGTPAGERLDDHYLLERGELPDEPLVATCPVSVRVEDEKGTGGNIVSAMTVQVRSDIEDPVERLKAVHAGTAEAKELSSAVGAKSMTDYTQFIPSTLTAQAARLASRWGLLNRISPFYNCVITNVPGPQVPLYNTGARMVANYGTGPILDGMALFHAITSYCGDFGSIDGSQPRMMKGATASCMSWVVSRMVASWSSRSSSTKP